MPSSCGSSDWVAVYGRSEGVAIYELLAMADDGLRRSADWVALYEAGLAAYRERRWPEAERHFGRRRERADGGRWAVAAVHRAVPRPRRRSARRGLDAGGDPDGKIARVPGSPQATAAMASCCSPAASSSAGLGGKRMITVVPTPSSLLISKLPSCNSANDLTSGRPRPVPSCLRT